MWDRIGVIRHFPVRHFPVRQILVRHFSVLSPLLAACINYVDLNKFMLRMRGHVFAGFFHCDILLLQGKHNGFRHIVARA